MIINWTKTDVIVLPLVLIGMICLTIFLRKILKNKPDIIRGIPLQVIAGICVILEVIKQGISILEGYDEWMIPLHYCSLFVFFFPFAQYGSENVKRVMKPLAFITAGAMSLVFYFSPEVIIGNASANYFTDFYAFHTFTYHHLAILYVFLSLALKDYIPEDDDYKSVLIVMSVYCVLTTATSHILDTNYCNFLYGTLDLLEQIRLLIGQVGYTLLISLFVAGGTTLITYLYTLAYNDILKRREVIKKNKKSKK